MKEKQLKGNIRIPGDKSISHRALIFAAFTKGTSTIEGLSPAADCQSTANCLKELGLNIVVKEKTDTGKPYSYIEIESPGVKNLLPPQNILFVGNSGTSIRLLAGLAAGQPYAYNFDGDQSIRKRPMSRVLDHLEKMGAKINYLHGSGLAPFVVHGGDIHGKEFTLKVASAQVQTALLLAGLQATGKTTVHLPGTVRDHTARMFDYLKIPFIASNKVENLSTHSKSKSTGQAIEESTYNSVTVEALAEPIAPFQYKVPGDISSAAFFMVAAACTPNSKVLLTNVGLNRGRTLVIDVLKRMGANINLVNERIYANEPIADIEIIGSTQLSGTEINEDEIASGVDEIPILAVAGAVCSGKFSVRGASELRHKESDRLKLITDNLKLAGADITELDDGFIIHGNKTIPGGTAWQTHLDHRLAMSGLVANLLFENPLNIEEIESTAVSYPNFVQDLNSLLVS